MINTILSVVYMLVTGDYPGHAFVGHAEDSALVDAVLNARETVVL